MLFKRKISEMPSRSLIAIGMSLFLVGTMLSSISQLLVSLPDFWSGSMLGLGAIMIGTSIVFNLRGLVQVRAERRHE